MSTSLLNGTERIILNFSEVVVKIGEDVSATGRKIIKRLLKESANVVVGSTV